MSMQGLKGAGLPAEPGVENEYVWVGGMRKNGRGGGMERELHTWIHGYL